MAGSKTGRTSKAAPTAGVRERILEAAFRILHESGLQHLTQVKVAERAGVRQSHLTYYFPTRHDLLEAVMGAFVEHVAQGAREVAADAADAEEPAALRRLIEAATDHEHTRMFVALIVESDGDPELRAMIVRATRQVEAALASSLGDGDDALDRARRVVAAVWGLGLYLFVMRPPSKSAAVRRYRAWLEDATR